MDHRRLVRKRQRQQVAALREVPLELAVGGFPLLVRARLAGLDEQLVERSGQVLGEPIGSSLITWVAFGEQPPIHAVFGGAIVLVGIGVGFVKRR